VGVKFFFHFFRLINLFCFFKTTASIALSNWSYSYNGQNGIYLSKFESSDTHLTYWSTILDSDYKPPYAALTNEVMRRLLPGQWLNKSLINKYVILSLANLPMEKLKRVRVFRTDFYYRLSNKPDDTFLLKQLYVRVS
jgi:hypothetical protein